MKSSCMVFFFFFRMIMYSIANKSNGLVRQFGFGKFQSINLTKTTGILLYTKQLK